MQYDIRPLHSLVTMIALGAALTALPAAAGSIGDLNGDGKDDVLLRGTDGLWLYNAMNGRRTIPALTGLADLPADWSWSYEGIGDFDGDGDDDVLLRDSGNGRWYVYAMDGRDAPDEGVRLEMQTNQDWRLAAVGDFNGDGTDDLLLRHARSGRWYYNPIVNAAVTSERGTASLTRNQNWRFAGVGDLNADGNDDVLLRHVKGQWTYYPMAGKSHIAAQRGSIALRQSPKWQLAGIGNFDGAGGDEILLRHDDGRWQHYATAGRTRISTDLARIRRNPDYAFVGIGDLNGDGNDDVLLRRDTGDWHYHAMSGRDAIAGRSISNIDAQLRWDTADAATNPGTADEPAEPDPTGEPAEPDPTGEPAEPDPTGEPAEPDPTGEPAEPDPTGEPAEPDPTGEPAEPDTTGEPAEPDTTDDTADTDTTDDTTDTDTTDSTTSWNPAEFYVDDYDSRFKDYCAVPRTGLDPEGEPFPDKPGTTLHQNNWLRSWSHDTYLWYDEIVDRDPALYDTAGYFSLLKTNARTPSGALKDRFHYSENTAARHARISGFTGSGYGAKWAVLASRRPRDVRVRYTEPNSPATRAGIDLLRGTRVLAVDGVDVVNSNDVDTINGGLWPRSLGETHTFLVRDPGQTATRTITMTSAEITAVPVQHDRIIQTAAGPVGYMLFNTFVVQAAEKQLVDAFTRFENANVTDLILDLRYNGGGFLIIANQLAYMVAGDNSSGKTFSLLQFNDKHQQFDPFTGFPIQPDVFQTTTIGWSTPARGAALPKLDLNRVFVLSGPRTCSASELVVNALRGIDVEVVLIGETTCGKPYGFYPADNCGTTYSTAHFRVLNAKNFGDYSEGFSPANLRTIGGVSVPGCEVADDYEHQFGDPQEARVAAALRYRENSTCPPLASAVAARSINAELPTGAPLIDPTPEAGYMIATEVP